MELDLSHSIADRDIELELSLLEKLYSEYILKYVEQMGRIDTVEHFVHDNTYHNIESGHHIAYKYIIDSNTKDTRLITNDGNRAYEFLIEFDKKDPAYGIYYGCRGLILNGDQKEQIDTMLKEWEILRPTILTVLNNTFPNMNFTNRFQPTNNANNKTFWPFWITLGVEEDIIDVAVRTTSIIAKSYIEYLKNNNLLIRRATEEKEKLPIKTYFTSDAYDSIINDLDASDNESARLFKKFIRTAKKYNVIKQVKQYEKCFQFTRLGLTECAIFFEYISKELNLYEKGLIPWSLYIPLFLTKDGEMLTFAKNKLHYQKNYAKKDIERLKNSAENEAIKCLKFK